MDKRILPPCHNATGDEYEYCEYVWGDFISGSKEVLQRMGIGTEIGFPGEPGCNKRQVTTTDPRGFPCIIKRAYPCSRFTYSASIAHPGRDYPYPSREWHEAFRGVERQEGRYFDRYKGSAEALTASGIVPSGMFPGMPGMRSVRVSILADGTLPEGHRNANYSAGGRQDEGAMVIEKAGKYNYFVIVYVSRELANKRKAACQAHRQEWDERMSATPRAPRIDQAIRHELNDLARQKRAALRLVWSRPKFVPGFNTLPQGPFAR